VLQTHSVGERFWVVGSLRGRSYCPWYLKIHPLHALTMKATRERENTVFRMSFSINKARGSFSGRFKSFQRKVGEAPLNPLY